jgi:hypothetical protein
MEDIEKEFYEDIDFKKKAGRVSFVTKSYRHRLRSAADLMTPYQRAKHRKAGKVEISNMYDVMVGYDEFLDLSTREKKKHMIEYRNRFTNAEIVSTWGISKTTYFALAKELDLPRAPRTRTDISGKRKVRGGTSVKQKREEFGHLEELPSLEMEVPEYLPQKNVIALPKHDGMQFNYSGVYSPNQILSKLEKLSLLLSDEENKFDIKIFIQETEHKVENVG